MPILGVDGCRAGWIAASADDVLAEPTFQLFDTFEAIVGAVRAPGSLALVDVPIGLSDDRRVCDGEARAFLGGRRASSVFTPPSRPALAGTTPPQIRRLNVAATGGRSLSSQAVAIVGKIREVDSLMTPLLQTSIRETHPECTFAALSPARRGLPLGKRSAAGRSRRLELLPPRFASAARGAPPFPAGMVAADDYVDALAALVAALRARAGAGEPVQAQMRCRMSTRRVISGSARRKAGKTSATGAFQSRRPRSTSLASRRVVRGLVLEATRNRVSGVTGSGRPSSRTPKPASSRVLSRSKRTTRDARDVSVLASLLEEAAQLAEPRGVERPWRAPSVPLARVTLGSDAVAHDPQL